jgi:F-type H+-transporting ATPase subunit b
MNLALIASEGGGGFNPLDPAGAGIALWTWVIFLVALVPIWKLVMGPITRGLIARDEKSTAAIAAAEAANKAAQEARAEVDRRLAEAQRESAAMVEAARARADAREKQLVEEAKKNAADLLERARAEIRAEQDKALATIRKQVVDLSLSAAGQVLKRKVDASDDRRLVEELVSAAGEKKK